MLKKIAQTIKLRKYKTKIIEESLKLHPSNEYLVWYKDNTTKEAWNKNELISVIEKDHIKPIRYIFDMADRIILDRDIIVNIEDIEGGANE